MEEWAKWIASNPFLEALAIIVAVGTLIIFLSSTLPVAFQALKNAVRFGVRRAFYLSLKPALRMSERSYIDIRLITLDCFHLSLKAAYRVSFLPLLYLMTIFLFQMKSQFDSTPLELPTTPEAAILAAVSLVIAVLLTIFIFRPLIMLVFYIFITRRKVRRQIRQSTKP